jgi:predicted nucleic acid-binding protein
MTARVLLDTNVLVYAYGAATDRRRRSLDVIGHAARNDGALPVQVLAEFASVALRKIALDPVTIDNRIAELTSLFMILPLNEFVVREALRGVRTHRFAYYDAQIWAAAKLAQIPYVISEDSQAGAEIEGVAFLNPFERRLDLTTL